MIEKWFVLKCSSELEVTTIQTIEEEKKFLNENLAGNNLETLKENENINAFDKRNKTVKFKNDVSHIKDNQIPSPSDSKEKMTIKKGNIVEHTYKIYSQSAKRFTNIYIFKMFKIIVDNIFFQQNNLISSMLEIIKAGWNRVRKLCTYMYLVNLAKYCADF